jgi:RHS repeat-associated protein
VDEYTYTFDRAGNRTSRGNALESALSQLFDYDDLNQLISADRTNGYTQDWELDGLGNWSSFDDDGTAQTRDTNAANEITSTTNLATPAYDRAGNMVVTPKPGDPANAWDVTYDAWNRVVEVTDGTTTITYQYDGAGRRIVRDDGSTDEHFYYDGDQVVETRVPDGMSGYETDKQYVWSLRYIDSPILRDVYASDVLQAGDRIYYLTDANHNVTAVTDVAGAVLERYDYDAFGKVTVYDDAWANPTSTSAVGNTLFVAGQDVDIDTRLQYSRARWYSSSTGGFISRDPIGFGGQDLNVYRYAGNNPVNRTDPSGLAWNVVGAGLKGTGQGVLNIVNGLQDVVIGIANVPGAAVNGIAWLEEKAGILNPNDPLRVPSIPSPDWSRGMLTDEGGTGLCDTHNWSKFAGATGVTAGLGAWSRAAQLARAQRAREAALNTFDEFFKNPLRGPEPYIPPYDPHAPRFTPPGDWPIPRNPRPGGPTPPFSLN